MHVCVADRSTVRRRLEVQFEAKKEQVAQGADDRGDRSREIVLLEPQMLEVVQQAQLLRDAARNSVVLDVAATGGEQ